MKRQLAHCLLGGVAAAIANTAVAGTDIFFNPLTQSSAVATPDHVNELNSPWQTPPGVTQENLTSLREAESDPTQSLIRVPGLGSGAAMFDMTAYSSDGKYLFIPHETQFGAGVSRYDIANDHVEIIFQGDGNGASGNWSNDYGALDPATWSPKGTLLVAEEWSGEGRVMELLNPMASPSDIEVRELNSIPNVAHEGLRFSGDGKTLYFIDEWNSGSIYKFVPKSGDYTRGQVFVLKVDGYAGNAAANWNDASNAGQPRTGIATWIPLTDKDGNALTSADPFLNGPSTDPATDPTARGGRAAADEVGATPYGRPEDMEVGRLRNGHDVLYIPMTSELTIYGVEELWGAKARVFVAASETGTPKNLGFPGTTGTLDSPDNLAQDALGNIYIVEDWPNGSNIGGDIWFLRDVDSDGVAESLDHFLSLQVDGAESTGMIFNPMKPTEFVISVQHPDSTALDGNSDTIPDGFGDAVWKFDLSDIVPPPCDHKNSYYHGRLTCSKTSDYRFVDMLERAGYRSGRRYK